MKVIIAGSRNINQYEVAEIIFDYILKDYEVEEIVSGCARGVDKLGEQYAYKKGYKIKRFPAPWNDIEGKPDNEIKTNSSGNKYWTRAGYHRNQQMAEYADMVILLWDGQSSGTIDMFKRAEKNDLNTHLVQLTESEDFDVELN